MMALRSELGMALVVMSCGVSHGDLVCSLLLLREYFGDVGATPGDVEDSLAAGVLHLGPDAMVVVASSEVRAEGFSNERASQEFQ